MAAGLVNILSINRTFEWCTLTPRKKITTPSPLRKLRPELRPYFGGDGHISGIVEIGTVPVKRRVRLYEANSGNLIQEIWSNADGTYAFPSMKKGIEYTVVSVDCARNYNDVIAARVTAV